MSTPPFLMTAALLYWGLTTSRLADAGQLFIAGAIALILEGSRLVPWRFAFSGERLTSLGRLCIVILVSVAMMFFFGPESWMALAEVPKWLPVIFLPIFAAQVYAEPSPGEKVARVPVTVFSFGLGLTKEERQALNRGESEGMHQLDLTYFYFGLVLAAANVMNKPTVGNYLMVSLLLGWALWQPVTRRWPAYGRLALLLVITSGGFGGYLGLRALQHWVENLGFDHQAEVDPWRSYTRIGDGLMQLKQSDRVRYRVKPLKGGAPSLIREASYQNYEINKSWSVPEPKGNEAWSPVEQSEVQEAGADFAWLIAPSAQGKRQVRITGRRGRGSPMLLAVPEEPSRIYGLPVNEMEQNRFGTLRVTDPMAILSYTTEYISGISNDSPPTEADLAVGDPQQLSREYQREIQDNRNFRADMAGVREVAEEIGLTALDNDREKIRRLREYFWQNGFSYSLTAAGRAGNKDGDKPLTYFLRELRQAHCEYYATVSALLLRAAGVPARYAVGYSVQEYSPWEGQFLVRSSHAHAWTLVYLDGKWEEVDFTPPSWVNEDVGKLELWQRIQDIFGALWLRFEEWRLYHGRDQIRQALPWVLGVILLLVLFRAVLKKGKKRRRTRSATATGSSMDLVKMGLDSPYYQVVEALKMILPERRPGETQRRWQHRAAEKAPWLDAPLFHELLERHYRYRFSHEQGKTTASDKQRLEELSRVALEELAAQRAGDSQPLSRDEPREVFALAGTASGYYDSDDVKK